MAKKEEVFVVLENEGDGNDVSVWGVLKADNEEAVKKTVINDMLADGFMEDEAKDWFDEHIVIEKVVVSDITKNGQTVQAFCHECNKTTTFNLVKGDFVCHECGLSNSTVKGK